MKYVLSVDWLQLWCKAPKTQKTQQSVDWLTGELIPEKMGPCGWLPAGVFPDGDLFEGYNYKYKKEPHGTRQFRELWTISYLGADFAHLQCKPCSSIFDDDIVCVKFDNRILYLDNTWQLIDQFIERHSLKVLNITRCDICADFITFHNDYHPLQLISDFMNKKIRHVGRGGGAAYFNHFSKKVEEYSRYTLNYTGLSFGSHESDARVYLYDKSHELVTEKNKPYIIDRWKKAGLVQFVQIGEHPQMQHVWRLEVSLKSKAMKFKDKNTKQDVTIDYDLLKADKARFMEDTEVSYDLGVIYLTFVKQLFSFIRNHSEIKNVTREPRIKLFASDPEITRSCVREKSCSSRSEKILIHSLWNLATRYRGEHNFSNEETARSIAKEVASNTDLDKWLLYKSSEWESKNYK